MTDQKGMEYVREVEPYDFDEHEDAASEHFGLGEGYSVITHACCASLFGPKWLAEQEEDKGILFKRGLYVKNGKAEQIMRMIVEGYGTRHIVRTAFAAGKTVIKYRLVLQKLGIDLKCSCGKPAAHQDRCIKKVMGGRKIVNKGKRQLINCSGL